MTRHAAALAIAAALVAGFAAGMSVRASEAPRPAPHVIPAEPMGVAEPDHEARTGAPSVTPSPAVAASPTPRPAVTSRPRSGPAAASRPAPHALAGVATWYAAPTGIAAAGPALRRALGPSWRGSRVLVCSGGRCVAVTLGDWCACRDRGGLPTLIDLSRSAFARLADPSRGLVVVTVSR